MNYDFKYNVYIRNKKQGIKKSFLNEKFAYAFVSEFEKVNKLLKLKLRISIAKYPITSEDMEIINGKNKSITRKH